MARISLTETLHLMVNIRADSVDLLALADAPRDVLLAHVVNAATILQHQLQMAPGVEDDAAFRMSAASMLETAQRPVKHEPAADER